jgi:hypothetical protein
MNSQGSSTALTMLQYTGNSCNLIISRRKHVFSLKLSEYSNNYLPPIRYVWSRVGARAKNRNEKVILSFRKAAIVIQLCRSCCNNKVWLDREKSWNTVEKEQTWIIVQLSFKNYRWTFIVLSIAYPQISMETIVIFCLSLSVIKSKYLLRHGQNSCNTEVLTFIWFRNSLKLSLLC